MTTAGITNTTAAMILAIISSGTGVMAQTTPFAVFDRASEPVLNDPHDLEIGPDGMLYVADKFHNRITVMDPQTLEVTGTFGDGQLIGAHDISFGPDGSAHVAVTGLGLVATYDFPDGEAKLRNVIEGLYRTEGALAHSNGRIYAMISATGELVSIENGQAVASAEGMYGAHDVAEAPDGSIWVADNGARRLLHYSEELELLQTLDGPQFGFVGPRYLDVDDLGRLVVADQDAHRILMIDPEAETVLGVIGDGSPGLGPNRLDDPEGVEIHGTEYYFSDSDNNRIVKYVVVVN